MGRPEAEAIHSGREGEPASIATARDQHGPAMAIHRPPAHETERVVAEAVSEKTADVAPLLAPNSSDMDSKKAPKLYDAEHHEHRYEGDADIAPSLR